MKLLGCLSSICFSLSNGERNQSLKRSHNLFLGMWTFLSFDIQGSKCSFVTKTLLEIPFEGNKPNCVGSASQAGCSCSGGFVSTESPLDIPGCTRSSVWALSLLDMARAQGFGWDLAVSVRHHLEPVGILLCNLKWNSLCWGQFNTKVPQDGGNAEVPSAQFWPQPQTWAITLWLQPADAELQAVLLWKSNPRH